MPSSDRHPTGGNGRDPRAHGAHEPTPVGRRVGDVLRNGKGGDGEQRDDEVVVLGIESGPSKPVVPRVIRPEPVEREPSAEDEAIELASAIAAVDAASSGAMSADELAAAAGDDSGSQRAPEPSDSGDDLAIEAAVDATADSGDAVEAPADEYATDEAPAEEQPSEEAPADEAAAEEFAADASGDAIAADASGDAIAAADDAVAPDASGDAIVADVDARGSMEITGRRFAAARAGEAALQAAMQDVDATAVSPAPPMPRPEDVHRPVLTDNGKRGPLSGAQWKLFEIGDLLGEGGMAAVYLARHRETGRLVALKVMPNRLADDDGFRRRFQLEAETAGKLDSDNVVRIYSAGNYSAMLYLEMEYVRGESLGDIIRDKKKSGERFTVEQAVDYAVQTARALSEAAKHNIVHRDIKPGNLMLTVDGMIKLTDFGIVKVMGEESLTMAGTAVGTPAYMSPEQGRGDVVDQRADLYSLGCVLYELLTMQQPFEGNTADALIYQHHFTEPKLVADLNTEVNDDLQAVVFTCLQKDPDKRYQRAEDLVADLEALRLGSPPTTATFVRGRLNTGAAEMMRKHGAGLRRRWWPWALAAVATLAIGAGAWQWWEARGHEGRLIAERLAVLDSPQAIPAGASDDLARLARLVGQTPEVVRWRAKLDKAAELEKQLGSLDQAEGLDFAKIRAAAAAARTYAEMVGADAPAARHWRDRLAEIERKREAARAEAAALDAAEFAPVSLAATLSPTVDAVARWSPTDDADVARWRGKLASSAARVDELRGRLAALDAGDVAPAPLVEALGPELAKLAALAGESDPEVARWAVRVRGSNARIADLRKTLGRFDEGDVVADATRVALTADWDSFQKLTADTDPDRRRWLDRLAATDLSRDQARAALAALDGDAPISVDRHEPLRAELDRYAAIVGDADADEARWRAALDARVGRVATLKQVLTTLAGKDQLTLTAEEQRLLRTTIEELDRVRGLDSEQAARFRATLARSDARLVVLRDGLASLDRAVTPPADVAAKLGEYERLAGADDERAARWRRKLDEVSDERARLAPLDRAETPTPDAGKRLARLVELVGRDDRDASRWGAKLDEIKGLKDALAAMDQPKTPPADASTQLARLAELIGGDDADLRRWRDKLARIDALSSSLASLADAYLLPDGVADRQAELVALVGGDDPRAARATARVKALTGPAKPAWAIAEGRDAHGRWADLELGKRFSVVSRVQRMRWVPPGHYLMGSAAGEKGRDDDEREVPVTISRGFWCGDSEVTQGLWTAVMGFNPSYAGGERSPVERVSWKDAMEFIAKIDPAIAPAQARLPSEAEWEYACRAGATGAYDAGESLDAVAVYKSTAGGSARPVKSRAPNPIGLYDMHGNVWEWCRDGYAPYPAGSAVDPLAGSADLRVVRGGSWGDDAAAARSANRASLKPDVRSAYVGLRFVIPAEGD